MHISRCIVVCIRYIIQYIVHCVSILYIYVIIDKCNGRKKKKINYTYTESNNNNPGFKHTNAMTMHILLNVPAVSTMR